MAAMTDSLISGEPNRSTRGWGRRSLEFVLRNDAKEPISRSRRVSMTLRESGSTFRHFKTDPTSATADFDDYGADILPSFCPHGALRARLVEIPVKAVQPTSSPLHFNGTLRRKSKIVKYWKEYRFKLQDSTVYCSETDKNGRERERLNFSVLGAQLWTVDDGTYVYMKLRTNHFVEFEPRNRDEGLAWAEILALATTRDFDRCYEVGSNLGTGNFSDVNIGYDRARQPVAIKIMTKRKADRELLDSVKREVQFLQLKISHPRLVQTVDFFDTKDYLYIVMECVSGGTLLDALESRGTFTEREARDAMRSVFEGLEALHTKHVCHRDLKLENILLMDQQELGSAKVADFGLSEIEVPDSSGKYVASGMYGTPLYCSPEVARNELYTTKIDIWSAGVVLYRLLSGLFPFDGDSVHEVLRKVKDGVVTFPDPEWKGISPSVISLIRRMLDMNPNKRPAAGQALRHEWMALSASDASVRRRKKSSLAKQELL